MDEKERLRINDIIQGVRRQRDQYADLAVNLSAEVSELKREIEALKKADTVNKPTLVQAAE